MKRKQERFKIIEQNSNVIEPSKSTYLTMKGKWRSDFFQNNHPVTLELACGRGEYTIGLAKLFPERNFIGVDIKGERIWKGSTIALQENLQNACFLRTHILMIENFFEPGEVNEIWLTFPDPRPRKRDVKRRLTSARYIEIYKRLLQRDGFVRLKTDNTALYEYTLEEIGKRSDVTALAFTADIYTSDMKKECFDIKTRYEQEFAEKGEKIKYLRFRFV